MKVVVHGVGLEASWCKIDTAQTHVTCLGSSECCWLGRMGLLIVLCCSICVVACFASCAYGRRKTLWGRLDMDSCLLSGRDIIHATSASS